MYTIHMIRKTNNNKNEIIVKYLYYINDRLEGN